MTTNKMTSIAFVVARGFQTRTLALVTAKVSDAALCHGGKFVEALTKGVTEWVQTAETGKRCFEYAEDDLNIGDLCSFGGSSDQSLRTILEKYGIFNFCEDSPDLQDAEDWHHDTTLVDTTAFEEQED